MKGKLGTFDVHSGSLEESAIHVVQLANRVCIDQQIGAQTILEDFPISAIQIHCWWMDVGPWVFQDCSIAGAQNANITFYMLFVGITGYVARGGALTLRYFVLSDGLAIEFRLPEPFELERLTPLLSQDRSWH